MKRDYFIRLVSGEVEPPPKTRFAGDVALIRFGFENYMRSHGFAAITISHYLRHLVRVAYWIKQHRGSTLEQLTRRMAPGLLQQCLPGRSDETLAAYRKTLNHWFRFRGIMPTDAKVAPWQNWIDEYIDFLKIHRGVGPSTVEHSKVNARAFLHWRFGCSPAEWSLVHPSDVVAFAMACTKGVAPIYAKARLGGLRRFLQFVQLRGACFQELPNAIPKIAVHGDAAPLQILTKQQQRELRKAFDRRYRKENAIMP